MQLTKYLVVMLVDVQSLAQTIEGWDEGLYSTKVSWLVM